MLPDLFAFALASKPIALISPSQRRSSGWWPGRSGCACFGAYRTGRGGGIISDPKRLYAHTDPEGRPIKGRLPALLAALALGAGAALGVAACGDDDDETTTVEEVESMTTEVTETTETEETTTEETTTEGEDDSGGSGSDDSGGSSGLGY